MVRLGCMGLFALEEELVKECMDRLTNVVLQVEVANQWVWKLHLVGFVLKTMFPGLIKLLISLIL
jgi:hypothetical protein